jgi:hypothetical protein
MMAQGGLDSWLLGKSNKNIFKTSNDAFIERSILNTAL